MSIQITQELLDLARDEIVETVMLFGEWPQPSPHRPRRIEFDLVEWIYEEGSVADEHELCQYFVLSIIDRSDIGAFEDSRIRWENEITDKLRAHFSDEHGLVLAEARRIAEEREEIARESADESRRGM